MRVLTTNAIVRPIETLCQGPQSKRRMIMTHCPSASASSSVGAVGPAFNRRFRSHILTPLTDSVDPRRAGNSGSLVQLLYRTVGRWQSM